MTMHQPRPRVICNKRQHQIPIRRQHRYISPRGIHVVQRLVRENTSARSENIEVMAVQMDGMRNRWRDGGHSLDDPEGPGIGFGKRDEVHVRRVGGIARLNVLKGRLVPIHCYGGEVEVPLEECLLLGVLYDGEAHIETRLFGNGGVLGNIELHVGDELGVVVAARCASRVNVVACCIRGCGIGGTGVGEDGHCIGVLVAGASCFRHHMEPVAVDCLVGVDDNIIALSNADEEPFRVE